MKLIAPYLLVVLVALGALTQWQRGKIKTLTEQRNAFATELQNCAAQVTNMLEDNASDNEIDDIIDLSDFGSRWLRDGPRPTLPAR